MIEDAAAAAADVAAPVKGASLRKDGADRRPPFRRLLIANRGEIALRIVRACHELGIEAVAVYSDADATAAHVRAADAAIRLGPAPAADSYLRADLIVDAARAAGAEAVHPGYGFLAERAEFARAVEATGIVFVGPTPEVIGRLGDKLAARRAAQEAGVPVVPGTLDAAETGRPDRIDALAAQADGVGYPLLVKAAAGGGGRGMRQVGVARELPAAVTAAAAEAMAAFGDGSVYLERLLRPVRHIEVQLVGDAGGTVVAIGERDCSVQRRHQKLLEESPAPGLTAVERAELLSMAARFGMAAGLRSAATVEFLFDEERRFWFLEVNTRLQVEHGVTELVADVDLVREQIRLAAGTPLSASILLAADRAPNPGRHAIEVRLSAEDPARGFAPAPGRIGRWAMPAGPGVRVDTAVEPGERVPPEYDPLVAKLLVVDRDRPSAIGRLRRALDEVAVTGIQTTLPFHRFVAGHPAFRDADLSTDWVADHWEAAVGELRAEALEIAARAAATAAWQGWAAEPRPGERSRAPAAGRDPGAGGTPASDGWRRAGREEGVDRWPR